ncbi:hypothetical protein B2J93_843 [Marssonina coronariae]|uniref:Uncharacterized protein n=1 Tax=Diplocarpon coronariae TaxID=2795749 RepID=A0A218ZEM4_9HELO|nr:hypothetical protein B2J93_843 [Marssonina coronariae]
MAMGQEGRGGYSAALGISGYLGRQFTCNSTKPRHRPDWTPFPWRAFVAGPTRTASTDPAIALHALSNAPWKARDEILSGSTSTSTSTRTVFRMRETTRAAATAGRGWSRCGTECCHVSLADVVELSPGLKVGVGMAFSPHIRGCAGRALG